MLIMNCIVSRTTCNFACKECFPLSTVYIQNINCRIYIY